MYFEIERLTRIINELSGLRYSSTQRLHSLKTKEGFYEDPKEVDQESSPWLDFSEDDYWGGMDVYQWFKMEYIVPENLEGKVLLHRLFASKPEPLGGANHPQLMIFVNGELRQGLDVNHTETLLTTKAKAGERFVIDLQGYSGTYGAKSFCINDILVREDAIEALYYDLNVPLEVAKHMAVNNQYRMDSLKLLTSAINLIDFREVYSEAFYKSIEEAHLFMRDIFYGEFCKTGKIRVKGVGHTHIDVAWLWDIDQTRQKVQRSFATVLELMKEYPEYIFMSSQPQLYQFVKEERPELYAQIKERIKEKRWEPEGAMWVEADTNIPSGESLVRQILFGKRFFREEFGYESETLWLPDVFGYSAALPQLLKQTGIKYFMTTKISWNEYNKLPYDSFMWEGIDGSKVLTHFITTTEMDNLPEKFFTTYNGDINPGSVMGSWERYQQKNINEQVLISYGFGDGGGGPTKEMLEMSKRLSKGIPGCPTVELTTSKDFFDTLEKNVENNPKLPRWVGELYFEYHRGTLTTMARNKRYNRLAEIAYQELEWLCSMNQVLTRADYPTKEINMGWKMICLNQFHDIIPGSSIKKVYDDSKEHYEAILKEAKVLKQKAIEDIVNAMDIEQTSLIVFNPLSFERDEVVEFEYQGEKKSAYLTNIPSKGYRCYAINTITDSNANRIFLTPHKLENQFYEIMLNDEGEIISLMDKRHNRQVIKEDERANVFQAFEDKPHNWDAWDINIYYQEKMWSVHEDVTICIEELTDEKGTLCISRKFGKSTIRQYMTIFSHIDRIDFHTFIDWKETHVLLKVAFPVDIVATEATYDIQFGNIKRPTHWNTSWDMAKFEVCGHKWADISEDGYGVSLLNDCKYGFDIKDGVIRQTLLKSSTYPNPEADKELHEFTYSLYPHGGDWREGNTTQMAYRLNQPVTAVVKEVMEIMPKALCATHEMMDSRKKVSLGKTESFVSLSHHNVILETIKVAENGEGIIIRLYENYNRRTKINVNVIVKLNKVLRCDLEENTIDEVEISNSNSFDIEIKPYEVITLRLLY